MIMLYPVGIPCLYFVLTWNSRHALNPDPLFVVADVACDGKLTKHNVPIHKEMRQLANSITMIHGAKADVRKKAIEFHATKIAEQDAARARVTSDDSQGAIDQGVSRQRSSLIREGSSAIRDSVTSRATKLRTKLRDQNFVAENWEDYLPEEAAVVIQLEASVTTVEAELVHQYRNANPSVQLLAFLVGAYEPHFFFWESIECLRRLALTGLLVFFCRRDAAANPSGVVNCLSVALPVLKVPTLPRRSRRLARDHGPIDDIFSGESTNQGNTKIIIQFTNPLPFFFASSSSRCSYEPTLFSNTSHWRGSP